MQLFWLEISRVKQEDKQDNSASRPVARSIVSQYPNLYLGNDIDALGNIRISLNTTFSIAKRNTIVSSATNLLSDRIGKSIYIEKDGEIVENRKAQEITAKAKDFFAIPTLHTYIERSIKILMASGQKFSTANSVNWLGEVDKVRILDNRNVAIKVNDYDEVVSYEYRWKKTQQLPVGLVADYVAWSDLDNPILWQSPIYSVVYDVMIDDSIAKRNIFFFKNNADPSAVYMLDPENTTNESAVAFKKQLSEKYSGNGNNSKPLVSNVIKDVKVLELSNREIEMINQRLHSNKMIGVALGFDLRLLAYMKDTGGSYSEIDSLTLNQANSQIKSRATHIENSMNLEYTKLVWDTQWYKIKLENNYFANKFKEKEIALEEVKAWVKQVDEYRDEFWYN